MNREILVTGASGFVGGAIMTRLRSEGRPVLGAVRWAMHDTGYVMVESLGPDTDWSDALGEQQIVVHTAARVHMMSESVDDPLVEFRRANVAGTLNLARQSVEAGVRRFIFISSVKVNGEGTHLGRPFTADDPPAPVDPYAISKFEAENGLRQLAIDTGMEVVIIRPPLIYGAHVKGNFLRLLRGIDRGIPLPFANVDNRRSLLNVRNLADLIVRCIEHPAATGETFLVSDGEDLATDDLVRYLAVAMGRKPRLFPVPLSLSHSILKVMGRDDLWQRLFGSLQVSCDKARDLLGWNPPVSMFEGLEEVGRWYIDSKNKR